MKLTMLRTLPGGQLFPGTRLMKGEQYDVPNAVAKEWVRRRFAEPVSAGAVVVAANDDEPKRGPRRASTEE